MIQPVPLAFLANLSHPEGTYLCPDCNLPREGRWREEPPEPVNHDNCPNFVSEEEEDG